MDSPVNLSWENMKGRRVSRDTAMSSIIVVFPRYTGFFETTLPSKERNNAKSTVELEFVTAS
ncbi:hypothetical protein PHLCEN_2v6235 [Hermanssonia centrifuga]|uniref:Uncharacterized protein n=1 Tax=Hermanssonia centrifuga TaxID=98765 RepID=A0A2R6P023_9APHY|nr:hypothetical protein PHLCEN_2v6235 [Hermanssonia centrifuga]